MHVALINTGGTFNKSYNTITGLLDVKSDHSALEPILQHCHNVQFEIHNILAKDSLDMTLNDRHLMLKVIQNSSCTAVIIVHGTDTMDETAQFLAQHCSDKKIILTGAMTPMSIDEVEATLNFSTALGVLNVNIPNGIYIAMHGAVCEYDKIIKDKKIGQFLKTDR